MIKLENKGKNEIAMTLNEKLQDFNIPYGNLSDNTYGEVICINPYDPNSFIIRLNAEIDYSWTRVYLFRDNVRIGTYNVNGAYTWDFPEDKDNIYYAIYTDSDVFPDDINYSRLKITNENTSETVITLSDSVFNLSLKNTQSLVEVNNIKIYDTSTSKTRFNKFNIFYDNTILDEFQLISESKTLEPSKVYFVNGDVFINDESFLNIPSDTYIFYNENKTLTIEGAVNNPDNIIPIDWTYVNNHWFTFNNTSTYLFEFTPGYYDYTIKTSNNEIILEAGKLLIEKTETPAIVYTPTENTIVYTPTENTIVYIPTENTTIYNG